MSFVSSEVMRCKVFMGLVQQQLDESGYTTHLHDALLKAAASAGSQGADAEQFVQVANGLVIGQAKGTARGGAARPARGQTGEGPPFDAGEPASGSTDPAASSAPQPAHPAASSGDQLPSGAAELGATAKAGPLGAKAKAGQPEPPWPQQWITDCEQRLEAQRAELMARKRQLQAAEEERQGKR
jgi:hypothetical protein